MRVLGGLSLLTKKHNKQTADETPVEAEEEGRSSLKRTSSAALLSKRFVVCLPPTQRRACERSRPRQGRVSLKPQESV